MGEIWAGNREQFSKETMKKETWHKEGNKSGEREATDKEVKIAKNNSRSQRDLSEELERERQESASHGEKGHGPAEENNKVRTLGNGKNCTKTHQKNKKNNNRELEKGAKPSNEHES